MSETAEQAVSTLAINEEKPIVSNQKGAMKGKKMKTGHAKKAMPIWQVTDRTVRSAALRSLQYRVKDERIPNMCLIKTCKTKVAGKSQWCKDHKKAIRKEQLRLNNIAWQKRVKAGTAKHHVVYRGRPTQWAAKHKDDALRLVKKGRSVVDRQAFLAGYRKVKATVSARSVRRRS